MRSTKFQLIRETKSKQIGKKYIRAAEIQGQRRGRTKGKGRKAG